MTDPNYRVLARKYRPVDFDGLIGQEVLVRTLSNAIATGRIAQAYVLTGVRGVGKTTTARILARAFNCIGPDGKGSATAKPCGVCEHCRAIAEDRHVDVVEMDAASNNSVDNIREIVEASRYRPASARYKIYILDEVHMLSNAAFNALLKTLEEPPPHLKFIFATTEIRKVPVTVLSRCQRFDLRRVEVAELSAHFSQIAREESVEVEAQAMELIARAADGSVRDGLSILDQAIALAEGAVVETQVRDMLGLADRGVVFDLAEALLGGQAAEAIAIVERMHAVGADASVILNDLLELTHWLTRLKIDPNAADDALMPEAERVRGKSMAEPLSLPVLARLWQALLKGVGELNLAPSPQLALEMVLVRTAYMANLPSPADVIKQMQGQEAVARPAEQRPPAAPAAPRAVGAMPVSDGGAQALRDAGPAPAMPTMAPPPVVATVVGEEPGQSAPEDLSHQEADSFQGFVAYLEDRKIEPILTAKLRNHVRPISFSPGHIELALAPSADADLVGALRTLLQRLYGKPWQVEVVSSADTKTLAEAETDAREAARLEVLHHPMVQATLEAFPGAEVREIRQRPLAPEPSDTITPAVDEDD